MEKNTSVQTIFTVHGRDLVLSQHEHNKKFVLDNLGQKPASRRRSKSRDVIPSDEETAGSIAAGQYQEYPPLHITTNDSHRPKDPKSGFMFGTDAEECDIVLGGDRRDGISRKQFAILVDWTKGLIHIENHSRHHTRIYSQEFGEINLEGRRLLLTTKEIRIQLLPMMLEIRFPNHTPHWRAYLVDWKACCTKYSPVPPSIEETLLKKRYEDLNAANLSVYHYVHHIGTGTFGTVNQVVHCCTGVVYAAKVYRRSSQKGRDHEADILATLHHENIIKFVGREVTNTGLPMLVMEYAPGGNLRLLVKPRGSLSYEDVHKGLTQMLSAVRYLHEQGITHRDIKPDNILVQSREPLCLKLADFGLASPTSEPITCCGTNGYQAPELLARVRYNNKVDIWALGVVTVALTYGLPRRPQAEVKWPEKLRQFLGPKEATELAAEFALFALKIEPEDRPSAQDCLQHPFIRCQPSRVPIFYSHRSIEVADDPDSSEESTIRLGERSDDTTSSTNTNTAIRLLEQECGIEAGERPDKRRRCRAPSPEEVSAAMTAVRQEPEDGLTASTAILISLSSESSDDDGSDVAATASNVLYVSSSNREASEENESGDNY